VLKTLSSLEPSRLSIPLDDPAFVLALGSPGLLKAFTREGDAEWAALSALSGHLREGSPLAASDLESVRSVLARLRPSSARKYFRLRIGSGPKTSLSDVRKSPDSLLGPLRLAALDPRCARLLAEFILKGVAGFTYKKLDLRGPEWAGLLLKGVEGLPLEERERAGWRRTLESWERAGSSEPDAKAPVLDLLRAALKP
jgi:hypothetical protein